MITREVKISSLRQRLFYLPLHLSRFPPCFPNTVYFPCTYSYIFSGDPLSPISVTYTHIHGGHPLELREFTHDHIFLKKAGFPFSSSYQWPLSPLSKGWGMEIVSSIYIDIYIHWSCADKYRLLGKTRSHLNPTLTRQPISYPLSRCSIAPLCTLILMRAT